MNSCVYLFLLALSFRQFSNHNDAKEVLTSKKIIQTCKHTFLLNIVSNNTKNDELVSRSTEYWDFDENKQEKWY